MTPTSTPWHTWHEPRREAWQAFSPTNACHREYPHRPTCPGGERDGSSLVFVVVGTFILLFGWMGFNPGSTLGASDLRISVIAVNTNLAAVAGSATAMFLWDYLFGKPDVSMACNGMLAGLVAITAPCAFVSPTSAVIIGVLAGLLVDAGVLFNERVIKVDDPCWRDLRARVLRMAGSDPSRHFRRRYLRGGLEQRRCGLVSGQGWSGRDGSPVRRLHAVFHATGRRHAEWPSTRSGSPTSCSRWSTQYTRCASPKKPSEGLDGPEFGVPAYLPEDAYSVHSGLALSRRPHQRGIRLLARDDIAADLSQCCWHLVRK